MADLIRFPITNAVTGNCFTLALAVGSQAVPMNVLLDTGSSMTAVNADLYHPGGDQAAATSRLLQSGSFQGGGNFLAAVVRTPVALPTGNTAATVRQANLG